MSDFKTIMRDIELHWPATYQVLDVEETNGCCVIDGFTVNGGTLVIIRKGDVDVCKRQQLKLHMDPLEKHYPFGNKQSSIVLPGLPHISANFTLQDIEFFSFEQNLYSKFIMLGEDGAILVTNDPNNTRYYAPTIRLEKFLERLAEKRRLLRPLPIPIRDAINYYL